MFFSPLVHKVLGNKCPGPLYAFTSCENRTQELYSKGTFSVQSQFCFCLVLFVFVFFSLRIERKTTREQVYQVRLTFPWHFRFLRSQLTHPVDKPGWGWTTTSELLELHPASGSLFASLVLLCTCCGSLQCHQHVASAASVLAHEDTVFLLQSTCQAWQAALTVSNVETTKIVSRLGFFLFFIFNASFALKQSRNVKSLYVGLPVSCWRASFEVLALFVQFGINWSISWALWEKILEFTNIAARQRLWCDLSNGWMSANL